MNFVLQSCVFLHFFATLDSCVFSFGMQSNLFLFSEKFPTLEMRSDSIWMAFKVVGFCLNKVTFVVHLIAIFNGKRG